MPLTHRPDFKQALSTLHRLQQEAEGDPQAPTNQQWAQSSSSTWWSWQGSWRTPCSYESHYGVATAQVPFSVNQIWQQVETAARLDKLQLDWPEAALPRCAGVMGRSVFAAACLAVSRFLATAGHLFDDV